jgi:phosphatidylserine synthase
MHALSFAFSYRFGFEAGKAAVAARMCFCISGGTSLNRFNFSQVSFLSGSSCSRSVPESKLLSADICP